MDAADATDVMGDVMGAMGATDAVDEMLDVTGLSCPLPVLKARKRLKAMQSGQVLAVRASDPGAVADFKAFARLSGHALLAHGQEDGVFTFRLRRA